METLFNNLKHEMDKQQVEFKILNRTETMTMDIDSMNHFINELIKMKTENPIAEDFPLLITNVKNVLVIQFEYSTTVHNIKDFNDFARQKFEEVVKSFFKDLKILGYNLDYIFERNVHRFGFKYYIFYEHPLTDADRTEICFNFINRLSESDLNNYFIERKSQIYSDIYDRIPIEHIRELVKMQKVLKNSFMIPFNSTNSHYKKIFKQNLDSISLII